jgi:FKBP-type peptidyl-prolyl cis-trans isomerase
MLLMIMCICSVGEKRILRIPPHMGYGDRGAGADIPGATLLLLQLRVLLAQMLHR